jgi:hypothetical protein
LKLQFHIKNKWRVGNDEKPLEGTRQKQKINETAKKTLLWSRSTWPIRKQHSLMNR